jgi:hypothetical protein
MPNNYPEGWSAASEERRNFELNAYQKNGGVRLSVEAEAYAEDSERSECMGLAPALGPVLNMGDPISQGLAS